MGVPGSGDPVAYAMHLQEQPLQGVPAKPLILQFAKDDKIHPNPTTTAMLWAGDLAEQATFYRNDLALAIDPAAVPKDPHIFLYFNNLPFSLSPLLLGIALGAHGQMAEFYGLRWHTSDRPRWLHAAVRGADRPPTARGAEVHSLSCAVCLMINTDGISDLEQRNEAT